MTKARKNPERKHKKYNKRREITYDLHLLSNEPTEYKEALLRMFYAGVLQNTMGYADARVIETGEIVPMLVGLEYSVLSGKVESFPLALIIPAGDSVKYELPNGYGGYGEPTDEEIAANEPTSIPDPEATGPVSEIVLGGGE